jgi:L-lactate utilization protein LutC
MKGLAKENMLARIRTALGRGPLEVTPECPSAFSEQTADAGNENVVEMFCTELRRVGGHAVHVRVEGDVKEYLRSLLPAGLETIVASSISARVGAWLTGQNVSIISLAHGETAGATAEDTLTSSLLRADIGITSADYGIAETGTLVLITGRERHRLVSLLPPVHVCLLDVRHLLGSMGQLLARVYRDNYSGGAPPQSLTMLTGPSCTADIEQTLTQGMHGPRELHVLLHTSLV